MNSVYEDYKRQRQIILDEVPNKKEIEKQILKELKINMKKNKNNYFKLEDLMSIDLIKKHFRFIVVTGDRNIGKTTAFRNYIENNIINEKEEFIWLRNKDTEIKSLLPQEKQNWFNNFGWDYILTSGTVYESEQARKKKDTNKIIGHYKAINNIQNEKSIEYKNVKTIFYDEFNSMDTIKDKYTKLIQFITSVERQKKDFQVILAANYIKQGDEILYTLGLSQEKKAKQPLLIFNWIAGGILWNIPKGHYSKSKIKDTLGYRASHINFATYKQQYSGSYDNQYRSNIISLDKITNHKSVFNIIYQGLNMTLFAFSKQRDKAVVVTSDIFGESENVTYVFDKKDLFRKHNSKLIPPHIVKYLIDLWNNNRLFVVDYAIYEILISLLSISEEKEKDDIFDIITPTI